MNLTIRHPKDFWSGLFFIAVGIAAVIIARHYVFGTAAQMGPGYFPAVLGGLMIFLGGILAGRAIRAQAGSEPIKKLVLRPTIAVLGSVILFAALLRPLGLVASSLLLIALSSLGDSTFRKKEVAISAVLLTLFCVLLFAWGLKLDLPVWPVFMRD